MIVTPLDSAELDSKEQYVFYHRMIDFALKELIVGVQQNQLCTQQEVYFFKQYCDLLLYSIEAMRVKYMYDDEENMKVDLTDSGFPNYLEFRYLFNDLELREEYLGKLTSVEQMRSDFLDILMRKKQPIPKRRLFQAASIVYYSSAKKEYIFNRFVQGKIIKAPQDSNAEYLVSWSFYDVTHNRPFICFMYFDYFRFLQHVGVFEDFNAGYREKPSDEQLAAMDPLKCIHKSVLDAGVAAEEIQVIEEGILKQIDASVEKAQKDAFPGETEFYRGV